MRSSPREAIVFAAISLAFLATFAVSWFVPLSDVGVGDWDQFFSNAVVATRALLERGGPPVWTIQLSGGAPLAGDPQSLGSTPLIVVPLLAGPIVGLKLLVVMFLVVGFAGCYRLGRGWIGDPAGAVLFAFAFTFSGHFAIHLRVGHFPWVMFGLVPWIVLFSDRLLFDRESLRSTWLALVVCIVMVFLGPLYQVVFYFLAPVAVVYVASHARRIPWDRLGRVALAGLVAVLITAPKWVPVVEWQTRFPRPFDPKRSGWPLDRLASMLVLPVADYDMKLGFGPYGVWEYWGYVGLPVVALALLRPHRRWTAFAIGCVVLGFALSWQTPWGNLVKLVSPFLPFLESTRVHTRFMVLVVFGLSLLAGGGLAALRGECVRRFRWVPPAMTLAVVVSYAIVVAPIWQRVFDLPQSKVYEKVAPLEEPYSRIVQAPPAPGLKNLSSEMLPLLEAGAVVAGAYVTLAAPPVALEEGPVVEAPVRSRIRNHRIDLWGDFEPGDRVRIHLRYVPYWKPLDPDAVDVESVGGEIVAVIRRPVDHVALVIRRDAEVVEWIVSGLGVLLVAGVIVARRPGDRVQTPSG